MIADYPPRTAGWPILKRWMQVQIEELRNALEQVGQPPLETEMIRGRIAAYRRLIVEVEGDGAPVIVTPNYDER